MEGSIHGVITLHHIQQSKNITVYNKILIKDVVEVTPCDNISANLLLISLLNQIYAYTNTIYICIAYNII